MLDLTKPEFGQPISFENTKNGDDSVMGAHSMVSQYLNIKKNYCAHLTAMTAGDNHAYRYFCHDDCAYVFSVDILEALVLAIRGKTDKPEEKKDGCVIFFQGVKKDLDKKDPSKGYYFGRPTIIAAAYKLEADGSLQHVPSDYPTSSEKSGKKELSGGSDGFEHPGNGSSTGIYPPPPPPKEKRAASDLTAPVIARVDQEYAGTDFMILKKIDGNTFNWK